MLHILIVGTFHSKNFKPDYLTSIHEYFRIQSNIPNVSFFKSSSSIQIFSYNCSAGVTWRPLPVLTVSKWPSADKCRDKGGEGMAADQHLSRNILSSDLTICQGRCPKVSSWRPAPSIQSVTTGSYISALGRVQVLHQQLFLNYGPPSAPKSAKSAEV